MFFHYTRQFKLIVPLRCATNTLHDYLGYTHRQTYYDRGLVTFKKGSCVRAVVLRHPFERYHSACALMPDYIGTQEWAWHFAPFLDYIDQVPWCYIPFEQLGLYVDLISARTVVRSVVNCVLAESDYVANPYTSYQQLVEEVELYHKALGTQSQLSVSDWRQLTARSV